MYTDHTSVKAVLESRQTLQRSTPGGGRDYTAEEWRTSNCITGLAERIKGLMLSLVVFFYRHLLLEQWMEKHKWPYCKPQVAPQNNNHTGNMIASKHYCFHHGQQPNIGDD